MDVYKSIACATEPIRDISVARGNVTGDIQLFTPPLKLKIFLTILNVRIVNITQQAKSVLFQILK